MNAGQGGPPQSGKRLGVICSQFPEMHETFVIRELRALKEGGIPLKIYSLKFCCDKVIHPDWLPLEPDTYYMAWNSLSTWTAAIGVITRRPAESFHFLHWALSSHKENLWNLLKAVVVWTQSLALSEKMRKDGITHVHAHWATMPTSAAYIVSRLLGAEFSFTAHAWDIFVNNPSLVFKIKKSKAVITCTEFNRRHLAGLLPEQAGKVHLNYHGVNIEKFSSDAFAASEVKNPAAAGPKAWRVGEPARIFLSIGRFVEQKGYEDLVRAYHKLKDRGHEFTALIVGEGPLKKKIQAVAEECSLTDRIVFRDSMTQGEILELYRSAFAFVLPCVISSNGDRDGIPNVILEAMAAGLPVVSTSVSGVPEAVQDQRTGLCVPPHHPGQLADALEFLIRNEEFASELGRRAREYARTKFDGRTHMRQLVSAMRAILGMEALPSPAGVNIHKKGAQRIKTAQLIWSLEMGGAERVASGIALGLDKALYEVIVICMNHEGVLAGELKKQGIRVIALHKKPGLDFGMLRKLKKVLREERVEILHAHLFGAGFWARLAGRPAGVKKIYVHEHGMQPWRSRAHFFTDRVLAAKCDKILFVSKKVMDVYVEKTRLKPSCCELVPNGVRMYDADEPEKMKIKAEFRMKPDEKRILSIGRLSPEKGHADLIEAFRLIHAGHPAVKLVIIGDGPERENLERQCVQYGLGEKVQFAGMQNDVGPWLAAADLYVQPSRREGLSLAILEAMGAGVPVISTRTGDVEKVIKDGETGFLTEPGDPQGLSLKISGTLAEIERLSPLKARAREIIRSEYSFEHMIRAIEKIYQRDLESGTAVKPKPPAALTSKAEQRRTS